MELVAAHKKVGIVISRVMLLLPYEVPLDIKCGLDEYRDNYINKAAQLFDEHLRENNYKNFEIYGVAQSKMNDVDFDID